MDRKTIGIGLLSLTAALLLAANFWTWTPAAHGSESVSSRDYQAVTARAQQGGENLYIVDNKTGMMAVFVWDAGARQIVPRAVRPVADAFRE